MTDSGDLVLDGAPSGDIPRCGLCGEPMPPGEEMFAYHGYSGDCPKPPLPTPSVPREEPQPANDYDALHDAATDRAEVERVAGYPGVSWAGRGAGPGKYVLISETERDALVRCARYWLDRPSEEPQPAPPGEALEATAREAEARCLEYEAGILERWEPKADPIGPLHGAGMSFAYKTTALYFRERAARVRDGRDSPQFGSPPSPPTPTGEADRDG